MPNYWFDHVHLCSPEPLKTAEFYERVLGAKRVGITKLDDGRTLVDIILNESAIKVSHPRHKPLAPGVLPTNGIDHFGLMTDNLEAAVDELQAQGVEFVQEITPVAGGKLAFFLAPEGVLIELQEKRG